jgi:hypothetical protein
MTPLHKPVPDFPVDEVRCLECGTVYSKPLAGGTVESNPGCPSCGYVGWLAVSIPVSDNFVPRRFVEDPPQRPSA